MNTKKNRKCKIKWHEVIDCKNSWIITLAKQELKKKESIIY